MNKRIFFILIFTIFVKHSFAMENTMILKLKDGDVVIELFKDVAPNHVKRFQDLSKEKKYDGVVFHRVIEDFMVQTGDVQFGNSNLQSYDLKRAGTGGSNYPDLKAEFNDLPHERGTLSMARSANPNSANSQFFICFKAASHLDRQYTVFGKVVEGMEFVDLIKKGQGSNGEVSEPDNIISMKLMEHTIAKKPEQGRSNIDEAKAVCKELGYKTGSERFADCSLRILEININAQNSQQQAQMLKSMAESAEKSAKAQKIANLIRASRNLNQMYLDLSRQNASSGTTSLGTVTCRVYGTGANKRIQCY